MKKKNGVSAEEEQGEKGIKVKRARRRLYDPIVEHGVNSVEESITKPRALVKEKIEEKEKKDETAKPEEGTEQKTIKANEIVKKYIRLSMGVTLMPIPLLDMVLVSAIQIRMLQMLSENYGVKFSETKGKSVIAALIAGFHSGLIGGRVLGVMVKFVPGVGLLAGMGSMSVISGAITYGVGKVFVQHFESGGTFLDFDPAKVKEYFASQLAKGKEAASKLRK